MNPYILFEYACVDAMQKGLNLTSNPARLFSKTMEDFANAASWGGIFENPLSLGYKIIAANWAMYAFMTKEFGKPEFGIDKTVINGEKVKVEEDVVDSRPFCDLIHFKRGCVRNDPRVIIFAPLSGHYATLLRDTVKTMLPYHDVYITDWKSAADIPASEGKFDLEEYIKYAQEFITELGPDVHVLSICQSTVPVLSAISRIAEENPEAQPLSMVLKAGPVDTRTAACPVTDFAENTSFEEIRDMMCGVVPLTKPGAGRMVVPGYKMLTAFMYPNIRAHTASLATAWEAKVTGDDDTYNKRIDFYDEYFRLLDMPWEYYEQTVKRVFQRQMLALGEMTADGEMVDPSKITKTWLMTVEAGKDDISPPGHTLAAHGMTGGINEDRKYHHLQDDVGHYGSFSGRKNRKKIAPREMWFFREAAAARGILYDKVPAGNLIRAEKWDGSLPTPRQGTARCPDNASPDGDNPPLTLAA